MKPAYFSQLSADDDDAPLGEAKILGHVPPTCLLGGTIVWLSVNLGFDPCALCHGPRSKCGGREAQPNALSAVPDPIEDALLAYRDAIK